MAFLAGSSTSTALPYLPKIYPIICSNRWTFLSRKNSWVATRFLSFRIHQDQSMSTSIQSFYSVFIPHCSAMDVGHLKINLVQCTLTSESTYVISCRTTIDVSKRITAFSSSFSIYCNVDKRDFKLS